MGKSLTFRTTRGHREKHPFACDCKACCRRLGVPHESDLRVIAMPEEAPVDLCPECGQFHSERDRSLCEMCRHAVREERGHGSFEIE